MREAQLRARGSIRTKAVCIGVLFGVANIRPENARRLREQQLLRQLRVFG